MPDSPDLRSPGVDVPPLDAIVIGGGPAGLQAGLTLGRMHRTTLLLDSGEYRNARERNMHNFVTHDGRPPEDFRAAARADLARYDTVRLLDAAATEVERTAAGFRVTTAAGRHEARRLILATGLRDELPPVPGLADLWGAGVAHCPYCHGHEFAGADVAILGAGPHALRLALLLERIVASVTILAGDDEPDPSLATPPAHARVVRGTVRDVRRDDAGTRGGIRVGLADGTVLDVAGLFVAPTLHQAAPFAERLGARLLPTGCVAVDRMGRTGIPGLYAAGDLAQDETMPGPVASVLAATAAGQLAAAAIDQDAVAERIAELTPAA